MECNSDSIADVSSSVGFRWIFTVSQLQVHKWAWLENLKRAKMLVVVMMMLVLSQQKKHTHTLKLNVNK